MIDRHRAQLSVDPKWRAKTRFGQCIFLDHYMSGRNNCRLKYIYFFFYVYLIELFKNIVYRVLLL